MNDRIKCTLSTIWWRPSPFNNTCKSILICIINTWNKDDAFQRHFSNEFLLKLWWSLAIEGNLLGDLSFPRCLSDKHVFLCTPSHQSIIRCVVYHLDSSSMLLDGRGSNARWSCDWTKSAIIRNRRQLHCNYKGLRVIRPSLYRYPGILTDCCVRFFLSHLRVSDDDDVRWFVIKTHSSKWVIQHGRHIGSGWFLPVAQNLIIPDFGPPPRTTTSFAKCWRKHLVGTCYWYNFVELLNCALFKII